MIKHKIKEIIVVEGKNDANRLNAIFGDIDCIITNGSEVSMETIGIIKEAVKMRGVILFLDPDGPGKRIRAKITEHVSGCKHAFIDQKDGISQNRKKVGIEHATSEVIIKALEAVYELCNRQNSINQQDLIELGLIGDNQSYALRIMLSAKLKIGHPNGKQLLKRLNMFNISKATIVSALKEMGE